MAMGRTCEARTGEGFATDLELGQDGLRHLRSLLNDRFRYAGRTQNGRNATGDLTFPPHGDGKAVVTLGHD